jgi:undecaprenyl diphosphate synthase
VAIIMDGNGRWGRSRGLPRLAGHRAGVEAVRSVVEAAPRLGIGTLTLYAFSADNWGRPRGEVGGLMRLFLAYLRKEASACASRGIRISVIGRKDRLPPLLVGEVRTAETATRSGRALHLRLAIDYSARDAIVEAGRRLGETGDASRESFAQILSEAAHPGIAAPDVDLLVRSGGEMRLSDFMLWESAYAELVFTPRMWPDFRASDLEDAVAEFGGRDRRFGRIEGANRR